MQSISPMDRLICGDVGFGKTEVALRAAFLCSMNIKQTIIIAPTTLLAQQHLETFRSRFQNFPIRVEGITRFTKKIELDKIVEDFSKDKVDILTKKYINLKKFNEYDIIFMDLQMPEMDGFETTKLIRKFNKNIRIVALTASLVGDVKKDCLKAGMDGFLGKPFSVSDIQSEIDAILN